jgi:8-amino-7-oxononanoate synthase
LSRHPEVTRAFIDGASKHGVGSGASHLVTGHGLEHEALEEELAAFTGREKALVFSTGYMTNMGVIGALADQNAAIVSDKLNHASLIDGCRLSEADVRRYRHGDAGHAAELLSTLAGETRLVVTDGVFSMDGDIAPLAELARLARGERLGWSTMPTGSASSAPRAAAAASSTHFRRAMCPC